MAREIEIKLRLDDPDVLRRRLIELDATTEGTVIELNTIFDRRDGSLRASGCGLRVRTCRSIDGSGGEHSTLTFKGPREPGPIKAREELETQVEDGAALRSILGRLGYREVIVYEKRRETWRLDECEVTLDELPQLGRFLEIEGPSGEVIRALRSQLALDSAATVDQSYVELAATSGVLDAAGRRCLRF